MGLIATILKYIKEESDNYRNSSSDNYDYWNNHISYVYDEAVRLAEKYNADIEIVSLGALLHDIALIKRVGDRKDHHINGKILADEILTKYNYPIDKKDRVLSTIYNHRSSKNATNIEDLCVADADVLAHFDNIPMLFNSAFVRNNISLNDINSWMKEQFQRDYDDLSDRTKESFNERYNMILDVIFNKR